jgi:two-component system sensor histidine kinase KdpD
VSRALGFLLAPRPPSRRAGLLSAVVGVAACTLVVYPLKRIAPVVSLGVVYLLAVLVVSVAWGAWLGAFTGLLSAAAFNFFQLPPVGRFTVKDPDNWVALGAFLVVAVLTSSVAEVTRARTREALERRREADLATEMARVLLRGESLAEVLPTAAARMAQALELPSAAIALEAVEPDGRSVAFALREGDRRLGTLIVGTETSERNLRRLQERVVPALEALLSAALERERLLGGVVETAALLRAVSHDLRSPLTAIGAAGEAVGLAGISAAEREELAAVIVGETRRLSRLVENLLDLSKLEAGAAQPRREWMSVEEVLAAAVEDLRPGPDEFHLSIDRDLPPVRADAAQLERAFVNVLENARRYSGGHPVSVRARAVRTMTGVGDRLIVRIVDRGPGIPPAQVERVFSPFYRAGTASSGHRGSGLGLAIALGFTQASGGTLHVESLPGQGATFVFELPLEGELSGVGRASPTDSASAPTEFTSAPTGPKSPPAEPPPSEPQER